jgi:NitT/TauT family transport system substrate-binding protein
MNLKLPVIAFGAALLAFAAAAPAADLDYGKPGDPVHLTVGYQPYYTEAWSGVVMNGLQAWKKHLPAGSTVEFQTGLQGAIIINSMLAGKASIGYVGDMPAIVGATKRGVADLRILAPIGLGQDQCNIFLVRNDAPAFPDQKAAVHWLDGKTVAGPKGSCADRYAQAAFRDEKVTPAEYLNQSIEVITSGFRAGKLDAATLWEPTASRLVQEGLARRVAAGSVIGDTDGAFIDMREDLVRLRPDVVKGWLEAELDAELFLGDPKNASEVVKFAKAQTTGFTEKELWAALYHAYPAEVGGVPVRLVHPFVFTDKIKALIKEDTAFLHSIKSIDVEQLADDALVASFGEDVLKARGLTSPVAEVKALPDPAGG